MLAPSPAVQVLQSVKALLADADRWTKGFDARDRAGNPVSPRHERAHSFCLQGAVVKVEAEDKVARHDAFVALHNAAVKRGFMSFPGFNDNPLIAHGDLLKLIDEAIACAAGKMSNNVDYGMPKLSATMMPWCSGPAPGSVIWFDEANNKLMMETA